MSTRLPQLIDHIVLLREQVPSKRAMLVAISGIDGSGKSSVSESLVMGLQARGSRALCVHCDDWHNVPEVRFSKQEPGRHFYRNALRLDEMFEHFVLPLKAQRSFSAELPTYHLPTETRSSRLTSFQDIDVIVLEGILLLQPSFLRHYDYSIWVECSFETALERALLRNQEGRSEEQLRADYESIYFAAQRIHLEEDRPQAAADRILVNDERIAVQLALAEKESGKALNESVFNRCLLK